MALNVHEAAKPPRQDHVTDGGGFYCAQCHEVDCDWLGSCPHTPDLWCSLNPDHDFSKWRKSRNTKEGQD